MLPLSSVINSKDVLLGLGPALMREMKSWGGGGGCTSSEFSRPITEAAQIMNDTPDEFGRVTARSRVCPV